MIGADKIKFVLVMKGRVIEWRADHLTLNVLKKLEKALNHKGFWPFLLEKYFKSGVKALWPVNQRLSTVSGIFDVKVSLFSTR